MFLWTRPFVQEVLLGLMTSPEPFPTLRDWNLELGVLVFFVVPFCAVAGQLYLRLAASISVPKEMKKYCPPAIYTVFLQVLFADVILYCLLWSVSSRVMLVTDPSGLGDDIYNWGYNGAFLVFMVRLFTALLAVTLGEAFFPLALTGGIACGKSTFAPLLEDKGFCMIDADKIGHQILLPPWHVDLNHEDSLVSPKDSVYTTILETFGAKDNKDTKSNGVNENHPLLNKEDQTIDRAKLGALVFADPQQRQKLNSITHPRIFYCLLKQMTKKIYMGSSHINYVCAEIPLLFESGPMRYIFGMTMCVACTPSQQLERLVKRNPDLSKDECQKRIESQMPIVDKVKLADIVLWNDKDFAPPPPKKGAAEKGNDKAITVTDKEALAKQKEAQMQQVEKAMLVLKYRTKGILQIPLTQMLMYLTSAVLLSVSFKLYMASRGK